MNAKPPRIAIDTNQIWEQARHAIRTNREVLLAPIGVLVTLPTLAVLLLRPFPTPKDGEAFQAFLQRIMQYSDANWWAWGLIIAFQTLAFQVVITLLADPERPTVAGALAKAVRHFVTLLAAIVAITFIASFALSTMIGVGTAIGNFAAALLTTVLGTVAALFILARFSLIAPVVQLRGILNPARAMMEAFQLTRRCGWQLLGFLVLLYFATYVVTWLISAVLVLFAAMLGDAETLRFAQAVTQALSQSVVVLIMASAVAGLYEQVVSQS